MPRGSRLRVLQIVGGMNRGGAETWLMQVLRNIDRDRFQFDFLVHTTTPGAYDDEVRDIGGRIIPCLSPGRPWAYARNFRRAIREHGPYDVAHSHLFYYNALTISLAARLGIPNRIAHMYPLTDLKRGSPLRQAYRDLSSRLIQRYSTSIVFDSYSSRDRFFPGASAGRGMSSVLHCGIDLTPYARDVDRDVVRRRLSLPVDRPLIVYVARFYPHKNHAQFLRVADRLTGAGHRYHFAMVGSHGELTEQLRDAVRRRKDVSMIEGLPQVSDLLMASDVFFFPSLEEGFGLVAVEAAAAGLPVVATDLPTIREATPPGHHAYMFSPNDDRAAAGHIVSILDDDGVRSSLGEEAIRWSPRYAIRDSVDRLAALYESLAGHPSCLPPSNAKSSAMPSSSAA